MAVVATHVVVGVMVVVVVVMGEVRDWARLELVLL